MKLRSPLFLVAALCLAVLAGCPQEREAAIGVTVTIEQGIIKTLRWLEANRWVYESRH